MSGVVLPGGVNIGEKELQPPSKELLALHQLAVNQVGISELLKNIATLLEIQIKMQCGYESRNSWKQKFMEADKRMAELDELNDDSTKSDGEGEEDYPAPYESLQEREDPDREAKRRGGYPPEGEVAEEGA